MPLSSAMKTNTGMHSILTRHRLQVGSQDAGAGSSSRLIYLMIVKQKLMNVHIKIVGAGAGIALLFPAPDQKNDSGPTAREEGKLFIT